jgi:predicted nucleic acid-binding protein
VDAHSQAAAALTARHRPLFLLTPLLETEFANAIELGIFFKRYSRREAKAVGQQFLAHLGLGLFLVRQLSAETFELARSLSRRHTAKLGTRSLDVLHVASALILGPDSFFSFDERQRELARAEGLRVQPA